MDQLIDQLETTLLDFDAQRIEVPARSGFYYQNPQLGLMEWMPVFRKEEAVLMKMVGYHPANPVQNHLPTILSTYSLYSPLTGSFLAIADGTFLTALRTGAASAIASRRLAKPDSRVLGLIGAGAQAMSQLHALNRHFPLERVLVHDINPAAAHSFAARIAPLELGPLEIEVTDPRSLLAVSDIVCTATSVDLGAGPVIPTDADRRPWLHFNAVGSDLPGKTELPLSLLREALVIPDFLRQAENEGECQQLQPEEIGPELSEIIQKPELVRGARERLTVFDSTGYALEDLLAMTLVVELALKHRIGNWIQFEAASSDPLNPYEMVLSPAAGKTGQGASRLSLNVS
jgi:ornithine cyclodeaminase/alanine dehydrogenase-like protein (mu-crystallin family)